MLAAGDDPEERWAKAQRGYALLKDAFSGSEYLALAALLLSDTVSEDGFPALGARGRDLFKRMRKEHPFLTGREDSVFALLLAQSDRSDDELIEDMERCYDLLREHFPGGDGLQTASHVLALSTEDPTDKAFRVVSLYNAIGDILELDGFLATQKGYKGVFGMDKRTRIMHAAMLLSLSDQSSGQRATVNAAAQQATLAMIAAQQALMCAVIASSAAANAASGASH